MSNNRDNLGRFQRGHSLPGPGRPALAAELPFVEGIKAAGSAEKVAKVLERLAELALKGNVYAATVYLSYTIGKPKDHVDLTSAGKPLAAPFTISGITDQDRLAILTIAQKRLAERIESDTPSGANPDRWLDDSLE
jgi:hypothetical protein